MAGVERVPDGLRVRLEEEEVHVVASLAEGLAVRLEDERSDRPVGEDELFRWLAPAASRGDAAVDAELRGMLRDGLLTSRVERLRDLASRLRDATHAGRGDASGFDRVLDRDQAMRIVEALNDLRLGLAATIGPAEPIGAPLASGDRRADAVRLMDALAWLQGGLIDFVDEE